MACASLECDADGRLVVDPFKNHINVTGLVELTERIRINLVEVQESGPFASCTIHRFLSCPAPGALCEVSPGGKLRVICGAGEIRPRPFPKEPPATSWWTHQELCRRRLFLFGFRFSPRFNPVAGYQIYRLCFGGDFGI